MTGGLRRCSFQVSRSESPCSHSRCGLVCIGLWTPTARLVSTGTLKPVLVAAICENGVRLPGAWAWGPGPGERRGPASRSLGRLRVIFSPEGPGVGLSPDRPMGRHWRIHSTDRVPSNAPHVRVVSSTGRAFCVTVDPGPGLGPGSRRRLQVTRARPGLRSLIAVLVFRAPCCDGCSVLSRCADGIGIS